MDTLQITWFILFFVLFIGYAILDGFDLGIGVISLFTRKPEDRDILINTITPYWDGNEVWLLTAGGALFAAFPPVYATLFSAFYMPFMLLLLALIARAVSIEFRHASHSPAWVRACDLAFGLGSLVPALLMGVALANVLRGLPINDNGVYEGTFLSLLNPYSLLGGVLSLITFIMHGAAFGALKTLGNLQAKLRKWVSSTWMIVVILWFCLTVYTLFEARYLFEGVLKNPTFIGLFVLFLASILVITISSNAQKDLHTFLASSVAIACLLGMAGSCLFPRMIPSNIDLTNSLTLSDHSSTPRTLKVMLVIALTGMPLALIYHVVVYRSFKGKTQDMETY